MIGKRKSLFPQQQTSESDLLSSHTSDIIQTNRSTFWLKPWSKAAWPDLTRVYLTQLEQTLPVWNMSVISESENISFQLNVCIISWTDLLLQNKPSLLLMEARFKQVTVTQQVLTQTEPPGNIRTAVSECLSSRRFNFLLLPTSRIYSGLHQLWQHVILNLNRLLLTLKS